MKYFSFYFFIILSSICCSQDTLDNDMLEITYNTTFKHKNSFKNHKQEKAILLYDNGNSLYQVENVMRMDSLRSTGFDGSAPQFFSYNKYAIKTINNKIIYSEQIFENEFQYEEIIDFDWILEDVTKQINGYSCKSATLDYGGRQWKAWYTLEVPISSGPYKFQGLPGLIVKISDATGSYDFELEKIKKVSKKTLEKFLHYKTLSERTIVDRKSFNQFKYDFYSLSLNEQLKTGSSFKNNGGGNLKIVSSNANGLNLRDIGNKKRPGNNNFIELDYEK